MKEKLITEIQLLVEKHQEISLLWETAYRQTEGYLWLAILGLVILLLTSFTFLRIVFYYKRHNRLQLNEIRKQTTAILRGTVW